jgi:murein L,D-transpeptidase YafK
MKRRTAIAAVAALSLLWLGRAGWHELQVDRCLDRGDIWFDGLGCQDRLPRVDRILVEKSARRLIAFERGRAVREMSVALGREPTGAKIRAGDDRTPEGVFPIVAHQPASSYHRALRLGYPTAAQLREARLSGVDPGGDIMIHGLPNGMGWLGKWHRMMDWTRGCVAVTDGEMDWLYQAVPDGTPVEIRA